jgi:hypothetical protein
MQHFLRWPLLTLSWDGTLWSRMKESRQVRARLWVAAKGEAVGCSARNVWRWRIEVTLDSLNTLRDILEDQKIAVRVCQLHLESIQKMAPNISQSIPQSDQQPDQQVCTDAKGDWLELLCNAGIFVGAFIGVSNMISIQSLHDRGVARQPQRTQHQVWTGSDARVRETPSIRSTSTSSQDPDKWQCHLCGGGPHSYKITPACTSVRDGKLCGHMMCSICKM